MTDIWQEIIQQQQLESSANYIVNLTELAVLTLSGDDTESFLQNLLTNDVSELAINHNHLTGLCTPKGRLLSLFLLHRQADSYKIVLPKDMSANLLQRLTMYKLRSKVDISDDSKTHSCLGLIATNANAIAPLELPHSQLLKLDSHRFIVLLPDNESEDAMNKAKAQNWLKTSAATWNLYDIKSGLPTVLPDTKEMFTPQQVNLDLIGGVSFKKGCYPGQEVVARLHYLGSPSRRMFIAQAESQTRCSIGEEVKTKEGATAGHIVNIEMDTHAQLNLLLSLKLSEINEDLIIGESTAITLLSKTIPE